jgi:diguanylate cyclase (GGDEF)-like protein
MTLLGFSGLLNTICNVSLGTFVFSKNRKGIQNITYFVLSLSIALYSFGYFIWQFANNEAYALFWFRILVVGIILINVTYLHFVFAFLGILQREKKFLIACYIINFIFILLNFSSLLYTGLVPRYGLGFWPIPTTFFHIYLSFWFFQLFYGYSFLLKVYRKSSGFKREQIRYFLAAAIVGFFGGATNWPMWYNIHFPPYTNILISVSLGIIAYAVVTYRLMDIDIAIRDTTLRLVSSLIPAVIFLTIGVAFFSLPVMIMVVILTAIASALLYGPLRKVLWPVILGGKYDYQKILRESTKSLVSMLDLRQLLNYIVNTISDTVGVEKISLFLKEEGKRRYEIKASYGLDEELIDNYVLKINEGIIPWLKQSKTVFIKEEMERILPEKAFENIYGDLGKIGAEFILPLFYKDNLVGVLNLSNKQSGGIYNQTDIDILESLGAEAAIAIENARLHTEVITDELTELYQPKYFELRLREDLEKAKRYKHCLTLMMVEVDNFEEFKKSHGVEESDKLLKNIAGIVGENLRMGDIACRCGEKEFGIILPEITEEPWGNLGERLKKQIRETVEIGERLRRRVEEKELGITISIGIASFDGQNRDIERETLIRQAKGALSQAKREGNTVKVFYDEALRKEISTEVLEWIKETEETLVSGDIYVDLAKRTVRVKGEPIKLTPKAFDLLCLLMKKKGRVLNRSFLTESVWGYEYFGTTRTVDSHIKTLRQKLGAEGKKIETIKGVGYRFVDERCII